MMIDAMKNMLEADHFYLHSDESLEGWMFITFLALKLQYAIYKLLDDKKFLCKFSPEDLLMRLVEIKKININKTRHTPEIKNKIIKLLEELNIPIM